MTQPLKDRVAIIVGSSSGMGKATAATFVEAGAQVMLAARRAKELHRLATELGENAVACPTDVQDPEAVNRLVEATLAHFGRIDILVYVTGTNIPERSLEVLSNETWDMMIQTNLTGAFYCTKAVLATMRRQKSGLIIYVSSTAAKYADASGVSYQASKHGLTGLANGTFKEERDNGIRTSIIFPGLTDTPLVLKRPVPTPQEDIARALQPQDVADACLFVASLPPRANVPELLLVPTALA